MKFTLLLVSTLLLLLFNTAVDAKVANRFNKKGARNKPKPAKPKSAALVLDLTAVPTIEEILGEVELAELFPRLIRMGITESRLLLRLQPMDYRVMEMEWEEEGEGLMEKIKLLKDVVQKYHLIAKEAGQLLSDAPKMNKDRDKLSYGRLTMKNGVQSFEYALASFGGKVPRGAWQLRVAPYPHTGCPPPEEMGSFVQPNAAAADSGADVAEHEFEFEHEEGEEENLYLEDGDVSRFLEQQAQARIDAQPIDENYSDSTVKAILERAKKARLIEATAMTEGQRAQYDADRIANGTLENLSNIVYAVRRGECTYLDKADWASRRNASALLIINNLDRIDSPSSGLGIDPEITQKQVDRVKALPIFSMSNTSWPKLSFALSDRPLSVRDEAYVRFIPLKCGASKLGGRSSSGSSNVNKIERGCDTVEVMDAEVQQEVTSGHMIVQLPPRFTMQEKVEASPTSTFTDKSIPIPTTGHAFQFLTSNFGAPLPPTNAPLQLLRAEPIDACTEILFGGLAGNPLPVALVVDRGGCPFHVKMANVERSGARLAIIINIKDDPLQRIGGELPAAGHIGMPGILVTAPTGAFLLKAMNYAIENESASDLGYVTTTLHPAKDQTISDSWIDLAFYSWENSLAERQIQYQALIRKHKKDAEIAAWLVRAAKADAVEENGGEEEDEERGEL